MQPKLHVDQTRDYLRAYLQARPPSRPPAWHFERALLVLREIRQEHLTPTRWTQRSWARNAQGAEVLYGSSEAVCHCLVGAGLMVEKSVLAQSHRFSWTLLLAWLLGYTYESNASDMGHIFTFNDRAETTLTDVQYLVDTAIRLLEEFATQQAG